MACNGVQHDVFTNNQENSAEAIKRANMGKSRSSNYHRSINQHDGYDVYIRNSKQIQEPGVVV